MSHILGRFGLQVGEELRSSLVAGAVGSFGIRLASAGTAFGVSVVLARTLGPEALGIYAYALAMITMISVPAQFGLPDLVVRETAKARDRERWAELKGIWNWSRWVVALMSLALVGGTLFLAPSLAPSTALDLTTFYHGLVLVPLIALTRIHESATRGLHHVVAGQLAEGIVRPGLLLVLIVAVTVAVGPSWIGSVEAIRLHVAAGVLALFASALILSKCAPEALQNADSPTYAGNSWLKSALPLAFVALMALINNQADLIMLGWLRSAAEVGTYRVAVDGAMLVSFGVSAMAMVTLPHFARLYENGDLKTFQHLATGGARLMLAIAMPAALVFLIFGKLLLEFVLGDAFVPAYSSLAILSAAHVIHAGFGIVGPLLIMTGHEKMAAAGIAVAALINVTLNAVCIPRYGMAGAALATAISLIIWNIVLWIAVRHQLDIDSSVFGLRSAVRKSRGTPGGKA